MISEMHIILKKKFFANENLAITYSYELTPSTCQNLSREEASFFNFKLYSQITYFFL